MDLGCAKRREDWEVFLSILALQSWRSWDLTRGGCLVNALALAQCSEEDPLPARSEQRHQETFLLVEKICRMILASWESFGICINPAGFLPPL